MRYVRPKTLVPFLLVMAFNGCLSSANVAFRLQADAQCPMAGYFRDEADCRKFYRCAEHATGVAGQSIISKVEFNCPQGTIYDETLSSCNHISFVRNIPSGCDTVNPVVGGGNNVADNSVSSTTMSSTMPPSQPGSNPPSSNPPLQPLIPPSNLPPLPMIPEDQQNSMIPPSGIPDLPIFPGGHPGAQPPLPVFPGAPGNQEEQPAIPIPIMPPSNQEMSPNFPAVPGLPTPGNPDQFPPSAISVPVMQEGQQNPSFSFPSINIPNLPNGQNMPNLFPFNFNMFSGGHHRPSFSLPNIPDISPIPVPDNQLQSQNQHLHSQTPLDQNNAKNQEVNSQVAIAVPVENQNVGMSGPTTGVVASWFNPQKFPDVKQQHQISSSDNNNPNWAVPNNFPTFYTVLGSKTPILLTGQQSSRPVTAAYIIV